jgi:hypothetical protein
MSKRKTAEVPLVIREIKTEETLSHAEGLKRFKELDRMILKGLTQSLLTSRALREMEEGQYYTFGGFKSITEYGLKTMKLAASTVRQYVNAGRVAKLIDNSTGCRAKPLNEAQLRPLLDVEEDSKVIEIWDTAETLYGAGGLTQGAVADAKRKVLKLEPMKPTDIGIEQVGKTIQKAIRRGWEACQGERAKLLGELLRVLKLFYEELNYDDRSPLLNAIFKQIGIEESELPAKATAEVHPEAKKGPDEGKPAKTRNGRDYWDQLNWELKNPDLADVWHQKEKTVRQMRWRHKHSVAVQCEPEQYQQKLAAEKAKAKDFRQSSQSRNSNVGGRQKPLI